MKKSISELTIVPVEKMHGGQKNMAKLANGTWITTVGDGTAYDFDGNQWSEIPGKGFVNVPADEIDWSDYLKTTKE